MTASPKIHLAPPPTMLRGDRPPPINMIPPLKKPEHKLVGLVLVERIIYEKCDERTRAYAPT